MMPHSERPNVLGVEVTPGTKDELRATIRQHVDAGVGLLHVVTANPEYVMTARADQEFREAINAAGVITVDGAGLVLAMRLLHPDVSIQRYTGVALVPDLAEISANTHAPIFLLGAGPGIADGAAEVLRKRLPGADIVGTCADGSPRPEHDEESIRRIRASGATVVLVAYGAPAQIYWIHRNAAALEAAGVKVVSGIGGALDYISGHTPWAPSIVRGMGLEWLYRLLREPWRWRRQLALPQFALLVLRACVSSRRARGVE